jgi:hypothetical protein
MAWIHCGREWPKRGCAVKASNLFLNRTYRLKPEVFSGSVQADGSPLVSPDVAVVRAEFHMNRKRAWYFDAKGNAYRSEDFSGPTSTIAVDSGVSNGD